MKTIELRRRVPLLPADILDRIADERTWLSERTTVTVHSGRVEGIRLTTLTVIPPERLPAIATRFLGAGAELVQQVKAPPTAHDATASDLRIDAEVRGAPVDISIDIALRAAAVSGTDLHAVTRIVSSVPMFGGMVESALEPYVESLLIERLDKFGDL
ncbi:hypothetical protein GCM10022261_26790 [Brevibacterium daeguense]|uniref:DUF2505 domain-containing protein n=1 Tax=Brevibacterium daeguense TaxID=909936 RepID=A0ABP8EN39_9MICO|nr:DUF2505 domain-containing protein [Brevibacterium daeguense]